MRQKHVPSRTSGSYQPPVVGTVIEVGQRIEKTRAPGRQQYLGISSERRFQKDRIGICRLEPTASNGGGKSSVKIRSSCRSSGKIHCS